MINSDIIVVLLSYTLASISSAESDLAAQYKHLTFFFPQLNTTRTLLVNTNFLATYIL